MEVSDCGAVRSDCQCSLCKERKRIRNAQFCGECRKTIEACKKDAEDHDWMEDFKNMAQHPETFTAMMQEFSLQCPPPGRGRGKRRNRFDTDMLPSRLRRVPPIDPVPRSSAEVSP